MSKKHLDLGCGSKPRNPYHAELTFGCDIRDIDAGVKDIGFDYKKVNLVLEPIPYPDNYFDSVSAFDFLSMCLGKLYCRTASQATHSLT
jgi:hypothetical protein